MGPSASLANLKTSLSGTSNAFHFDPYAKRYLGSHGFRCNHRFSLPTMTERIINALCSRIPCTERGLKVAEA